MDARVDLGAPPSIADLGAYQNSPASLVVPLTQEPIGATLRVSSTHGFHSCDELLLINLQGRAGDTDSVGLYQRLVIQSVVDEETLRVSPQPSAAMSGTTFDQQRIVVQRIPVFGEVIIGMGGSITASAWDGRSGGIVALRARSIVIEPGGSIDVSGLGYRGGPGRDFTQGSVNGESFDEFVGHSGAPGTHGGGANDTVAEVTSAPNTAGIRGGGGAGGNNTPESGDGAGAGGGGGYGSGGGGGGAGNDLNLGGGLGGAGGLPGESAGGGGGGYCGASLPPGGGSSGSAGQGVAGGVGGSGAQSGTGGRVRGCGGGSDRNGSGGGGGGGGLYGDPALERLYLGSGGGAGGANGSVIGPAGGAGGGIVLLLAERVVNQGVLVSNGMAGLAAVGGVGGSGAGAGGSIKVYASVAEVAAVSISAVGGGASAATPSAGGGGAGGMGRIAMIGSQALAQASTPTAAIDATSELPPTPSCAVLEGHISPWSSP